MELSTDTDVVTVTAAQGILARRVPRRRDGNTVPLYSRVPVWKFAERIGALGVALAEVDRYSNVTA